MKTVTIVPEGWPCTLEECRPGFFMHGDMLGFKSEYRSPVGGEGEPKRWKDDAYCDSGEFFVLGADTMVQPVAYVIEEGAER